MHLNLISFTQKQHVLQCTGETRKNIVYNIHRILCKSLNFDDGLQLIKTPNSKSQKIRILHEINKKRF